MRQSSANHRDGGGPAGRDRLARALSSTAVRVAVVAVVFVSLVVVVRTGDGGPTPLGLALMLAILAIAALGTLGVVLTLAGFDGVAPEIAERLVADDLQRRLLTRWLERARWFRFVGGLCGCIVWAIGFQTNADLLVLGSVGICAGAVLAESHHFRRAAGPRTARLEVRSLGDYLTVRDRRWMTAVAGVSVVVGGLGLALDAPGAVVGWSLGALGTLLVIHLAQRRVAVRRRPALPDALRRADDLARSLAVGRGLARPATYASLAMVARALMELEPELAVAPLLGVVVWFVGLGMWWRNRRLGLDSLARQSSTPAAGEVALA